MSDNKLHTKIRALLAKAHGTDNEAEAEVFFAKAYELLERHQLDISGLEADDPMGKETYLSAYGAGDWDFRLAFAVAEYFDCRAVRKYKETRNKGQQVYEMVWFGRESARVTAIEMHKYLVATVRRMGKAHAASMGLKADTATRRIGSELKQRTSLLVAQRKAPAPQTKAAANALATTDQLEALVKATFPNLRMTGGKVLGNSKVRELAASISLANQVTTKQTHRLA